MTDSYDPSSFRDGWQAVGLSRDVTLNFQLCMDDLEIPLDVVYYFKPIATFQIFELSADEKFEDIDEYIAEEFGCDPDEILTVSSKRGPVIVMSEVALRRCGLKLQRWPERYEAAKKTKVRTVVSLRPN
jgi:hypothetical protein